MTQHSNGKDARPAACRLGLVAAAFIWLCAPAQGCAQPSGCALVPNDRNASEQVLRCGDLTIRTATDTQGRLPGKHPRRPSGAQLDSGALMIELKKSKGRKFQILTPHASAAVRGTKWAME